MVWVDPVARTFSAWGGNYFDVLIEAKTSCSGNGIRSLDDLIDVYKQGKKLHVIAVLDSTADYAFSVELFEATGPFPVTFQKRLTSIWPPDRGLWSGIYHDKIAFVLPWTQFRQDGEYTSLEAVQAAVNAGTQALCMAGEGYEVYAYAIHTTTVRVWRAKDANDTCAAR